MIPLQIVDERFKKIYEIILSAGEILKEGFSSAVSIQEKGIKDLVTEYDIRIENFLKEKLKKFNTNFVAEESFLTYDFSNSFIIDPIDGTTNFAHKIPHTAISVAYYENNKVIYGFVYNPILNEFFYAKKGEGAYLNDKKINVSKIDNFQRSLIATGFPYSSAENEEDLNFVITKLKHILPRCQDIRRLGSAALDLCYVASGRYEGFYEINLKPWDVAAGILILEEAGGIVSDNFGEEYDLIESKCIVASNGLIHEKFIEILNKK
ncbi:inositol monophosphatase [Caminibacter mediatlanticus TB-2]|uniref:Inositol-1-monophosphatase n=1 Tax=Caminibacter mediatlanticus TB-2 TaxID=391592 RepID=A0ABX5V8U8_9BACT|nr:inositol monophosphatase family protein [Caminibacter mediatlanticus]QCT94698.1 inositol monophosphatase [Caminibacter mediatlanticus TB-2]